MTPQIDITQHIIQLREATKKEEAEMLANKVLPEWMQKPFDAYFSKKPEKENSNVIPVNFGQSIMNIPKALAAGSLAQADQRWYEQGMISYKNDDGAILSVTFNKATDHDGIDVTVFVSEGDSDFLTPFQGQSNIRCSVYDKEVQLASLEASVNHDGSFMYAEGKVINEQSMNEGGDHLSVRFDDQ